MRLSKPALVYVAIAAISAAPLLGPILGFAAAETWNCTLDINSPKPCMVNGQDMGGRLSNLIFSGLLLVFTVPVGLLAFVIYTVALAKRNATMNVKR